MPNAIRRNFRDQALRTVRLPAVRGKIVDAFGKAIAENRARYAADLYLSDLSKSFKAQFKSIRPPKVRLERAIIDELEEAARFAVVSNIVLQVSSSLGEPRTLTNAAILHRHYLSSAPCPFLSSTICSRNKSPFLPSDRRTPPGWN